MKTIWHPRALSVFYKLPVHSATLLDRAVVSFAETGRGELYWDPPEHVLRAVQVQLQREGVDAGSVRWAVNVPGTGSYTLIGDGTRWELRSNEDRATAADITITATRSALARFLTAAPPRDPHAAGVEIAGKAAAIRRFLKAIEVFPPPSPVRRASHAR